MAEPRPQLLCVLPTSNRLSVFIVESLQSTYSWTKGILTIDVNASRSSWTGWSTASCNMVMLGNIWEETAETSVWLAVVRKWSGSFLATAHSVFWRQRYKQWQALWKAAAVTNFPTSFICAHYRKESRYHIGLLSHTRGVEQSLSAVSSLNTRQDNTFISPSPCEWRWKRNGLGSLTPASHLWGSLLTLCKTWTEISSLNTHTQKLSLNGK